MKDGKRERERGFVLNEWVRWKECVCVSESEWIKWRKEWITNEQTNRTTGVGRGVRRGEIQKRETKQNNPNVIHVSNKHTEWEWVKQRICRVVGKRSERENEWDETNWKWSQWVSGVSEWVSEMKQSDDMWNRVCECVWERVSERMDVYV